MPTNKITFCIESLNEVENIMNPQDFPEEGLQACASRIGIEIKHTEKRLIITTKVIASNDGKLVMAYAVEGVFNFDEISNYFEFEEDQTTDKVGVLPTLVGIVVDALRGMHALRLAGTPYYTILPYILPTQLLEATHNTKK